MKKRSKDQTPQNFNHSPFKSLKGFTPLSREERTKAAAPRKKERASGDDDDLFLSAVEGVRRIRDEDAVTDAAPKPDTAAPSPSSRAERDERLFIEAMKNIGTVSRGKADDEDDTDGGVQRTASSRMKQLKRGTMRISEELDLHGYLRDEAIARLKTFITAAFGRGQQAVLVITGKGINSPEGPVLRGAVAEWLRTAGKGLVAEFSPAPRDLGGSGAFVVFLKKR
jgi:DNA-nicking Smr family endonuclease